MWAEDQHGICRTPHPHYSSACPSGRTAGQHAMSGTSQLTAAVGAVPNVRQFLPAACLFTPALAVACTDQQQGFGHAVAAANARHGRWTDGSRLDAARSAALPRAAVATTSAGVRQRKQGRE